MMYGHQNFKKRRRRQRRLFRGTPFKKQFTIPLIISSILFGMSALYLSGKLVYYLMIPFHIDPHKNNRIEFLPTPGTVLASYGLNFCPDYPPEAYPIHWPIQDVIGNWPATSTKDENFPTNIHDSICVFEYPYDLDTAKTYRDASVPFVLRKYPDVVKGADRWSKPNYVENLLTRTMKNDITQGFSQWLRQVELTKFNDMDNISITNYSFQFKVKEVNEKNSKFLYDELYEMIASMNSHISGRHEQQQSKNVHCQFDKEGMMSELQYDTKLNFIVMLKGSRRYILAHPEQCSNFDDFLYSTGSDYRRQSLVSNDPISAMWHDDIKQGQHLGDSMIHELILQAGDVLFLPPYWLHSTIALKNINYQCIFQGTGIDSNQLPSNYTRFIEKCGL